MFAAGGRVDWPAMLYFFFLALAVWEAMYSTQLQGRNYRVSGFLRQSSLAITLCEYHFSSITKRTPWWFFYFAD